MNHGRLLAALLASATILAALFAGAFHLAFPGGFDTFINIFAITWLASTAAHLLPGSLVHVLLQRFGMSRFLHYAAAGATVGLLVFGGLELLPDSEPGQRTAAQALRAAGIFAVLGSAAGGIFWALGVRPSKHAA